MTGKISKIARRRACTTSAHAITFASLHAKLAALTGYVYVVYIHCGTLFDSIFHLHQSKQLTWRNRRSLSGPRKVWCSASHAPCTSPPASHYNINIAPYHIILCHYPIAGLFYRLKQKAFEECRAQGTAYADCCRGRTLSMAWKCRDEMAAYSDCVSQ